ncbi:LysE family transporter [Agromyces mariniharenae]|uniref:Lysine transporter LysE n=1 Tax=Agromyces mariniharenae TaxID=2604423 RepID=A0A5S4UVN8_9MICO|nr:LysE family transporter [Agromyces mariniharenae]TYL50248.1 lysine transporter LysE [Agromyces mariniharenae]
MSFSLWITLLAACFVISFTPGAGAINTMGNSLSHGFRRSIWGILGQQAALVVHIAIVALGVGVLVASSPVAFDVIRYAGAAYLVYLGVRQLLRRPVAVEPAERAAASEAADAPEASESSEASGSSGPSGTSRASEGSEAFATVEVAPDAAAVRPPAESRWSMFRRGLWVNLLNPKAIVFFLAFLPQFIRPSLPLLPQYVVVAATVVVVDVIVMWGFFALAAHGMRRFTRSARGQRIVDVVFGLLFIAVGVLLVFLH